MGRIHAQKSKANTKKLDEIFGGSLSLNVKTGCLFVCLFFYFIGPLRIDHGFWFCVFCGILVCVYRLPLCLYAYHAFSLVLFLILSYSNMIVYDLYYFILLLLFKYLSVF